MTESLETNAALLSEQQAIEIIWSFFQTLEGLRQRGVRRTALKKLAREIIHWVWETRELTKYDRRRPRSRALLELEKNGSARKFMAYDHAIPLSRSIDTLVCATSEVEVAKVLRASIHTCLITKDEEEKLRSIGLRQRMPDGWDGSDIYARYKKAGIEIVKPS